MVVPAYSNSTIRNWFKDSRTEGRVRHDLLTYSPISFLAWPANHAFIIPAAFTM